MNTGTPETVPSRGRKKRRPPVSLDVIIPSVSRMPHAILQTMYSLSACKPLEPRATFGPGSAEAGSFFNPALLNLGFWDVTHRQQASSENERDRGHSFAPTVIRRIACLRLLLVCAALACGTSRTHATVAAVSAQSPVLSSSITASGTTLVHFAATADSGVKVTGPVSMSAGTMFIAISVRLLMLG